jgi:hypothetical protein
VRYSNKFRHKGRWCYMCIMTTIVMTQRWEQLLPELYSKMMTYYSPPYPYMRELKKFCRACWGGKGGRRRRKGDCECCGECCCYDCECCEECLCYECECNACECCQNVYNYNGAIGDERVGYNCCWFAEFGECYYGAEGSPDCQGECCE